MVRYRSQRLTAPDQWLEVVFGLGGTPYLRSEAALGSPYRCRIRRGIQFRTSTSAFRLSASVRMRNHLPW